MAVYLPREQIYTPGATVALRSNMRPGEALGLIRRTVSGLDPAVALYDAGSLVDHLSLQLLPGRTAAGALSGLGLLALLLSATGIYGLVAYAVTLRTREIGIRMAIGAGATDVVRLVVGRVMVLLAAGVLAGLAAPDTFRSSLAERLQLWSGHAGDNGRGGGGLLGSGAAGAGD